MVITELSPQQITGALRSTGSSDRDVLFAKKEELLTETKRLKLLGIAPMIIGGILTCTIVGGIVGIPMLIFGFFVRKSYNHNIKVSDETFAEYVRTAGIA
jgi:hypothetical protein